LTIGCLLGPYYRNDAGIPPVLTSLATNPLTPLSMISYLAEALSCLHIPLECDVTTSIKVEERLAWMSNPVHAMG
jgi:hypothetical protein